MQHESNKVQHCKTGRDQWRFHRLQEIRIRPNSRRLAESPMRNSVECITLISFVIMNSRKTKYALLALPDTESGGNTLFIQ